MTSIPTIASKLTKAQRRFISQRVPNEGGPIEGWEPGVLSGPEQAMVERLVVKGLVWRHHYVGHGPRIRITPAGLSVRTHLQKEASK